MVGRDIMAMVDVPKGSFPRTVRRLVEASLIAWSGDKRTRDRSLTITDAGRTALKPAQRRSMAFE